MWQSFNVLQLAFGKTAWFCEFELQACVLFVRQSMKLVGAAFVSRFVSRFACIRCYFGFASTGNVREAPRVATRLDRGRSWSLPAPGAQTRHQCIEGFSFWARDVSVWQSFNVLQLAFGKTAWFCEFELQACVLFVRQSMKLVGAAFVSRFVSRFACIRCYFGFASTGNVREAPRVATRLDRGRFERIVHLRPSLHERPSRHGPPFLGPFATILDAWAHGRFHTVLHSVLQWRRKRWWQPIMGLGVEGYAAAATTSLDMTVSTNKLT